MARTGRHAARVQGVEQSAPPVPDDNLLVQMALEDPHSFRYLYERYVDGVFWFALARTHSPSDADDIVSETMLAALDKLDTFKPEKGSFAGWLFTIARRKAIDHQRAHQRLLRLLKRQPPAQDLQYEDDALQQLLRNEEAARIYAAYEQLSNSDQEVVALRYSAGLSSKEMSEVLNISNSATRMRLSRATRRLATLLGKDPN